MFVVGMRVMELEALVDMAKLLLSSCVVCDLICLFLALNFDFLVCTFLFPHVVFGGILIK